MHGINIINIIVIIVLIYLLYLLLTNQITFRKFLWYILWILLAIIIIIFLLALILGLSVNALMKNICMNDCCNLVKLPFRIRPAGRYDAHYDLYEVSPITSDWSEKMVK